jgi:2-aminoadipate transaminase
MIAFSLPIPGPQPPTRHRVPGCPTLRPGLVRFHSGYPFPEAIPTEELQACIQDLVLTEGDLPFHYSGSPACKALPDLLSERCRSQHLMHEQDALVVTSGACQAISLLTTALLTPADFVAVEGPTYMETLEIFRNRTPHILTYPVDADGLVTGALEADLRARRAAQQPLPKLLYTIPTFHNPTGTTLSLERRQHLLALADAFDFLIVEDAAYAELSWAPPPASLKQLDRSGRVIYVGSLSKVVAPGLRVGWAVGPEAIIRTMDLFKRDNDPAFAWAVAARFLQRHSLDERVKWLSQEYRQRCAYLEDLLRQHLPAGCAWTSPGGGYFIWLQLPPGHDAEQLFEAAMVAGVTTVPGIHFYPPGAGMGERHIRLSFSYLSHAEMEQGIRLLGEALRKQ